MTTLPSRTPCGANSVCTAHDYMLSMLSICRANSRVALRHLSVGAHLAARCLSQCLGRQELAALKHHATCFQALLGCSLCLPTLPFRPWRGITICNEKARRIVILNTAPPDFAGEPTSPEHINKKISQIARFFCDSEAIRTLDPRLRRALLYPAELRNRPCLWYENRHAPDFRLQR